jgi:hypothetical protein
MSATLSAQRDATAYWADFQRIAGTDLADGSDVADDDDGKRDGRKRKCGRKGDAKTGARATIEALLEREATRFREFVRRPIPEFGLDGHGRAIPRTALWDDLYATAPYQNSDSEDYGRGDRFALAALTHSHEWRALVTPSIFNSFFGRALDEHFRKRLAVAVVGALTRDVLGGSSGAGSSVKSAEGGDGDGDNGRAAQISPPSRAATVGAWIEAMSAHVCLVFPEMGGHLCDPVGAPGAVSSATDTDAHEQESQSPAPSSSSFPSSSLLSSTPTLRVAAASVAATAVPNGDLAQTRVAFGYTDHVRFQGDMEDYVQTAYHAAWCVGRFSRTLGVVLRDRARLEQIPRRQPPTDDDSWRRMVAESVEAVGRGAADAEAWTTALTVAVTPFLNVPGLPRLVAEFLDF